MIPRSFLHSRKALQRISPPRRRFFSNRNEYEPIEETFGKVRYLQPIIWSAATIATIYVLAAAVEIRIDTPRQRNTKAEGSFTDRLFSTPQPPTFATLEAIRIARANTETRLRNETDLSLFSLTSTQAVVNAWNTLLPSERAAWTAIGLNTALFIPSKISPSIAAWLYHLPVANRNITLLTSTFGHGGILHLLVNMYVLQDFTPRVATSRTFKGSAPHSVAFYLSSGIISCLAFHLQSAVKPLYKLIPCLGASGAIYAMVGVFGMSYPDARIGVILLPFSFPAQQALMGLAAFELYGTVFGTGLGLAHVSHLAGLGVGAGYVYFDGGVRVWGKIKRWLFDRAHKQNAGEGRM